MGANSGFPGHIPARADLVLYVSPLLFSSFRDPFFHQPRSSYMKPRNCVLSVDLLQGLRSLVVSPAPLQHLVLLLLPKSESLVPHVLRTCRCTRISTQSIRTLGSRPSVWKVT